MIRRLALTALLLIAASLPAHAQLSTQCPLFARAQSGNAYTLLTSDECYWITFGASGQINIMVPTPNSIFLPGYTISLIPLSSSGFFNVTVTPDPQTGNQGTVSGLGASFALGVGQSIELRVGAGTAWAARVSSNTGAFNPSSPPPIGSTTPNQGYFTTLAATTISATNLGLVGTLTTNVTGAGPQCLHASSSGQVSGTGNDCGSGGGGGGTSTVYVGATTGPANVYTLATTVPSGFTLTNGFIVGATISATNTGASTLNVNGTGAVAINKQNGAGFSAVASGDLIAGLQYQFVYNASSGVYVVINNPAAGTIPAAVNGDVIYGVGGVWTATAISSFGYLTANQTITLSGDTTGSGATAITTTTAKVNGVSYPSGPSTNTVPVVTSANTITYEAVPNAALANSSVTLNSHSLSLGGSLTLAFTDFAGAITAAQMLALANNSVYVGNGSNQPVATTLASIFGSPPAIGGTAAAAGSFTTLSATGNITTAISGGGTQCLHVNNSGVISGTAADCSGAAGSGTVNSGNTNQVAYYPGNASTVGGENTLTIGQTNAATRAAQTMAMMRFYGAL